MLTGMDKLIEPLKTTIYFKVKANSVKQEYEKQEELKRSALRAVSALSCIPDSGMCIYIKLPCVILGLKPNNMLFCIFNTYINFSDINTLIPSNCAVPKIWRLFIRK